MSNNWNWQRVALAFVALFAAISAVAGGYAVATGWIAFPAEWLAGNPIVSSYFVPGLILGLVVGGSSLAAFVATLVSRPAGAGFAFAAGLVNMGWIAGEILITGELAWLQAVYFGVGFVLCALSLAVGTPDLRAEARRLHLAA